MMFYLVCFIVFVLFVLANYNYTQRKTTKLHANKNVFEMISLLTMFLIVFLIITLQAKESNYDLQSYYVHYNRYSRYSVKMFISEWATLKDPFYHFCAMLFSKLNMGFYWWHTFIGFIYSLSLYNLIKRYSTNIYISYIVPFALGGLGFALSGLRQTLALAILMFSFKFIKEKKLLEFLVIVLLAGLFHSSAFVFVIVYFLYNMKYCLRNHIILGAIATIIIIWPRRFVETYMEIFKSEDVYSDYLDKESSLSIAGAMIIASILVFCMLSFMNNKDTSNYKSLVNLTIFSFVMRVLSVTMFAEMFRVSMYFSIFDTLLIADACTTKTEHQNNTRIKIVGVTVALMLYLFVSPSSNFTHYVFR